MAIPGIPDKPLAEMSADEAYIFILGDPTAHHWLKDALFAAWHLDPVDASNDADVMAMVLTKKCDELSERLGIPSA